MVSMTSNGGSIENGGSTTYGSGTNSGGTKVSSKKTDGGVVDYNISSKEVIILEKLIMQLATQVKLILEQY